MPYSKGPYAANETVIYRALTSAGLTTAAACGVLANLEAEAIFNPKNLQNSYESSLNYTDASYTKAVNTKQYKNFATDSAGYGIAQWTYSARKRALLDYVGSSSIGDLELQIKFLLLELQGKTGYSDFTSVWKMLKDVVPDEYRLLGWSEAYYYGYKFCELFEKPRDTAQYNIRGSNAEKYYSYYDNSIEEAKYYVYKEALPLVETLNSNLNHTVPNNQNHVITSINQTYATNHNLPDKLNDSKIVYDDTYESSLLLMKLAYDITPSSIKDASASSKIRDYYHGLIRGRYTSIENAESMRAGDVLLYTKSGGGIAVFVGDGFYEVYTEKINQKEGKSRNITNRIRYWRKSNFESFYDNLDSYWEIYRVLPSNSEEWSNLTWKDPIDGGDTPGGGGDTPGDSSDDGGLYPIPEAGIDPDEYVSITSHDPHAEGMMQNLSKLKASGFDLGYLIDLTHGGEFRFYIPEFTEQAGAQWSPIEIRGRSVTIMSYNTTASRNITISLDLYAGEGLYKTGPGMMSSDVMNKLHKDANFVKSLEYPDYSNVITRPPSTVQLILGSTINIIGVVSDVNVEHMKPLDSQNRSMHLKVGFKVTQTATNPPDYKDIRSGNYTIVNTSDVSSINNTPKEG